MAPIALDTPAAAKSDMSIKITGEVRTDWKSMNFPAPPTFTDKEEERRHKLEKLAAAFRIFAKWGYDEGISGHLTYRDPILTDCFWTNPLGLPFSLMTVSDLLLVNPNGDIIGGGKPHRQIYNTAAFEIHHAIHKARPEVNAACHVHSLYGKTFSTFGRPIDTLVQDACAFYEDLAVYPDFGGVVLGGGEGDRIAEHLGKCKAVLLQNHGILTVGETIESASAWYLFLDRLCHVQLLADAAANGRGVPPVKIGHQEATWTRAVTGTETAGWNGGNPYFLELDAQTQDYKL